MATIRGMMACSLDGFAADAAGGVGWLDPFHGVDWGYDAFIAQVGTVVMGRVTATDALALGGAWPYAGRRAIVLGRMRPAGLPDDAVLWTGGLPALVAHLRALTDGDAWVVGGPALQTDLIRLGALDRLQLCIVPRMLGAGLPVFPPGAAPPVQPELAQATALPMGLVMLDYRFGASGRGGLAR